MAELREQLARTPAEVVVANHAFGLFELAALHLSLQPPQLDQARLAIDALAALVDGLGEPAGRRRPPAVRRPQPAADGLRADPPGRAGWREWCGRRERGEQLTAPAIRIGSWVVRPQSEPARFLALDLTLCSPGRGSMSPASQRPSTPGQQPEAHRRPHRDRPAAVGDLRCSGTGTAPPPRPADPVRPARRRTSPRSRPARPPRRRSRPVPSSWRRALTGRSWRWAAR